MAQASTPKPADLVLAGGGVKGIGHIGVMAVLAEHGYRFERVAGTSAGAIVGALSAAGLSPPRLHEVMTSLDFRRFLDRGLLSKVPIVGSGLAVLFENGVFEGDAVRDWLDGELRQQGVRTFADLRIRDPHSSLADGEAYRLVVMATDVTRGELIRLPWDYARYGLDPDEQLVCDAVRASMSIPYVFRPVTLDHHGQPSTLVDGGVMSNFPIDAFDRIDALPPRWPTFGITLIPRLPAGNARLLPLLGMFKHGPLELAEELITTMLVGHDQTQMAKPWIAARAIEVDTDAVGIVDFGLTPADELGLYESGRRAGEEFMRTWDWDRYRDRFRPPPVDTR